MDVAQLTASADMSALIAESMGAIVTSTLAAFTAVAPVGIVLFGAMFAWKKSIHFFKGITK